MFMLMHATGSEECNSIIAITVTYCLWHSHTIAIEVFTYEVSVPVLE